MITSSIAPSMTLLSLCPDILAALNNEYALIPILGIVVPFVFILGIVALGTLKNFHERRLQHETIRLALEKGQPIPEDVFGVKGVTPESKASDLKSGLILIAVGIGSFFFLKEILNNGLCLGGLIPGLIGVALIINHFIESRNTKKE